MYSDQVIENVLSANNIVDIVSSRVQLTKKGKNYFGLCPFHNEKTPSFSVDPDRQYYYCFSCNKGGNAFRFIMETEKLTFPEALQRLAERANIVLPASSDPIYNQNLARAKERQARHLEMYAQAAGFFSQALIAEKGKAARAYMQKRMIRADMVRHFGLGYAYPDWNALHEFLGAKGFQDEEMLTGGLILKGKNGGYYDRFRNRIIFPIQDVSGRILAFGGRALDDSTPKYLNSPESAYYSKGKILYGLNFAKNTKEKNMLIVEGYMDLISLWAHGIDNAVAPLGTALTETQARLLKRYTDEVIIAFDADAAGQAAAIRGLDILENQGFRVRVLTIPESKDPDEFIKARGSVAFRGLIEAAAPLLEYKIQAIRLRYPADDVENDVRFFKDAVRVLSGVDDEIEREIYISRIASRYKISEVSIKSEIEKTINRRNAAGPAARNVSAAARAGRADADRNAAPYNAGGYKDRLSGGSYLPAARRRRAAGRGNGALAAPEGGEGAAAGDIINSDEYFIIALLSTDNSLWDIVAEKLPPEYIDDINARQALIYACDKTARGSSVSSGELMSFFTSEQGGYLAAILADSCHCEDNRRAMEQKIKDICAARAKKQMRGALKALEGQDLSDSDAARLKAQLSEFAKNASVAAGGKIG